MSDGELAGGGAEPGPKLERKDGVRQKQIGAGDLAKNSLARTSGSIRIPTAPEAYTEVRAVN